MGDRNAIQRAQHDQFVTEVFHVATGTDAVSGTTRKVAVPFAALVVRLAAAGLRADASDSIPSIRLYSPADAPHSLGPRPKAAMCVRSRP